LYSIEWQSAHQSETKGLKRIDEYKSEVTRLFPDIPKHLVDSWSIQDADALGLAQFLALYPRESVVVLDIGTFVGVSAFHFANQPKVSEVVSVDYNPSIAELYEWMTQLSDLGAAAALKSAPSPETTVIEVAKAALARFPEQQRKVKFIAGDAATVNWPIPVDAASFVAFVDGHHSKEAVESDLRAIFEKNPYGVAVLHDCTDDYHAPSVLAGITTFIETFRAEDHLGYHLRLFEHLASYSTAPNLGVVYPAATADQIEPALSDLLRF
jgi:hypothetical protein